MAACKRPATLLPALKLPPAFPSGVIQLIAPEPIRESAAAQLVEMQGIVGILVHAGETPHEIGGVRALAIQRDLHVFLW